MPDSATTHAPTTDTDRAAGHVRLLHDVQQLDTPLPSCSAFASPGDGVRARCHLRRHDHPHHAAVTKVLRSSDDQLVTAVVLWSDEP